MVVVDGMAQLVDDHIVQHLRRREHQQAVKIQIALAAAASPQGVLTADGDSAVGHTHQRGKIGDPFRYCLPRLPGKHLQLLIRKHGKPRRSSPLFQMLFNPVGFAFHEPANIRIGHPLGASHQHLAA